MSAKSQVVSKWAATNAPHVVVCASVLITMRFRYYQRTRVSWKAGHPTLAHGWIVWTSNTCTRLSRVDMKHLHTVQSCSKEGHQTLAHGSVVFKGRKSNTCTRFSRVQRKEIKHLNTVQSCSKEGHQTLVHGSVVFKGRTSNTCTRLYKCICNLSARCCVVSTE